MSSPVSPSDAATVPTVVPFSSTPKVVEEVNDGATFAVPSSPIVPVAVGPTASVAFDGFDSVTVKVSFASSVVSSTVDTVNIAVVSPGMKVSVLVAAVKSVPEAAVSPVSTDVAHSTVTVCVLAADSVTVKVTSSPSTAEASATLSSGSVPLSSAVTALVGALASVFANPPRSVQLALAVSAAPRSASTTV